MTENLWTVFLRILPSLLLPSLVLVLSVLFFVHVLVTRRTPASTFAWLLAVLLVPYLAIPLYLMFGGRKMRKMVAGKGLLIDRIPPRGTPQNAPPSSSIAVVGGLFPLRQGNRLRLLTTGRDAFHVLIEQLESARECICATTFILGEDATGQAILETLTRKAREGVKVRLLLDSLGSWGLSRRFFDEYRAAGGQVAFFMPMMHMPFRGRANLRNHRKIVVVDRRIAILGGMNLAEEYMGQDIDSRRWRDLSLIAEGPIVPDLRTVFYSDWNFAAEEGIECSLEPIESTSNESLAPVQVVPSGPDVEGEPLHDSLITSLVTASKRIWIVTPYFIPSEMLLNAICIAARRDVDVRIMAPRVSNHRLADIVRRGHLLEVQRAGGRVYLFRPAMLHAKLIVVDDSLAVIGSSNMDIRSLFLNYEISLFVYDRDFVLKSAIWTQSLFSESEEGVKPSTFSGELIEGATRLLSPLL